MNSYRDPRLIPLALIVVGAILIVLGAIVSSWGNIIRLILIQLGAVMIFFAWFWIYPYESKRDYELQVRKIKEELNHHPLPNVEFRRVLTDEYHERIEHWRKLRPGLKMGSGPLSKLMLFPNPPGIGYTPLEIWYRINEVTRYKRFQNIPYRGLLDGEPPIYWVVEVQAEDFHRDHIGQVHFALKYGHLNGRDCIYIARFFKTVGTLTWMLDRASQRLYVNDPRLSEWYRVLPPELSQKVPTEGVDKHLPRSDEQDEQDH